MQTNYRLVAAAFAVALLAFPALVRAADDSTADKTEVADKCADKCSDKAADAPLPPDVTTQGAVTVGGQHIAYNAIAGTITVGATDAEDAQLGLDGKPQPGSQLA